MNKRLAIIGAGGHGKVVGEIALLNKYAVIDFFDDRSNEIKEFSFTNPPYILDELIAGKYQLKYISDLNKDRKWTTGSWTNKVQAEKAQNNPSEITIRSNLDL